MIKKMIAAALAAFSAMMVLLVLLQIKIIPAIVMVSFCHDEKNCGNQL